MHKLLVTGGAGFIGSNFVRYWLDQFPQDRVVVLDALTYAGNLISLNDCQRVQNFRFVHGNICDQTLVENLMREEGINVVVHFAAESHVDRSISAPDVFIETNVVGTHVLLKVAKKLWLDGEARLDNHRFHHVSTDEVYGSLGPDDPPFSEVTPYQPNSPYAASKAASDHLVRAYHHTYGLQTTISNCSNNYGPYQFPEKLIPLVILNTLHGKPIPIYGDGSNARDWLHVEDHCRGIAAILKHGKPGEVYNVGGNNEVVNIDLVTQLCRIMDDAFAQNSDLEKEFPLAPHSSGRLAAQLIQYVKDRPGHDRRYAINSGKIQKELGYKPVNTFQDGLQKTVEWYVRSIPWWRQVMDGSYRQWMAQQYGSVGGG